MTSPSPAARALGKALRDARERAGLGLRQFAQKLKISPTNLSNWETALRLPDVETVATLLGALNVTGDERERVLELARKAHEPNWLTVGVNGIPSQLASVVECERAAHRITEWIPRGIPGLLQTPDYTREVKRAANKSPKDVDVLVMVQMGRQEIITRADPVDLTVYIDEGSFADPAILGTIDYSDPMLDQYIFLRDRAQCRNVHVHVVPAKQGWHPGWAGPFVLYEFPDASPVVYIEHHSSGAFLADSHDIECYRSAIERLSGLAKNDTESLAFIDAVIHRTEGK